MKRCGSHLLESGRCIQLKEKRWADFHEGEFQPYRYADRDLPADASDRADIPYASIISLKYNGGNAIYFCDLCQVDLTAKQAFESANERVREHCWSRTHQFQVKQVHAMRTSPLKELCCDLQRRMDTLPPASWQVEMQGRMISSLINAGICSELNSAKWIIEKHERREHLLILELAVWKSLCISKSTVLANGPRDLYAWYAWTRDGWRDNKASVRDANEIGIIVKSVLPFLDAIAKGAVDRSHVFVPSDHVHRFIITEKWKKVDGEHHLSTIRQINSTFRCDICEKDLKNKSCVWDHWIANEHQHRILRILELQKCPIKVWCANVKNRIEQYPPAAWTHKAKSKLFWLYLGYQSWSQNQLECRKKEIERLVYLNEIDERLHLVGLAVCKSLCLLHPLAAFGSNDGSCGSCVAWADWVHGGWKRQKCAMMDSSDIDRIIKCVRPFLGPDSGLEHVAPNEDYERSMYSASQFPLPHTDVESEPTESESEDEESDEE